MGDCRNSRYAIDEMFALRYRDCMDLKTYLDAERGRQRKLARAIGAHPSDLSSWKNGRRPVPSHFAYPIEESTGGAVTRLDVLPIQVCKRMWPREFGGATGDAQ